jgi:hypothetical protein
MSQSQKDFFYSSPFKLILKFTLPLALLVFILIAGRLVEGGQQFSLLAQSYLHGQANFRHPIGGLGEDPVFYHGKIFWTDGPFPAIILMPFVGIFSIFHAFFYQGYLEWVFIFGIIYFVYKLAKHFGFNSEDSLLWMFTFVLGSVFVGVSIVSSSWFFAQVLTVFLLFWSMYEFFTKKRWWLLGCICGALMLTRITAAPILIFYGLELIQEKKLIKANKKFYLQLGIPVVCAAFIIGLYNFIRFHNPFNGGVAYQYIHQDSAYSRSFGVFSLVHIPANLYSLLLRAPVPILKNPQSWILKFPYVKNNIYGMSIFITSPYIIYLFNKKWSAFNTTMKNLLIATGVSLLMVLTYYGLGLQQYGDRYSLDYLPEIFVLLMYMYSRRNRVLSDGMKFVLLGSILVNAYLLFPYALTH